MASETIASASKQRGFLATQSYLRQGRDAGGVTVAPGDPDCADASRQGVVRSQQPDQFRGPFPSLFHSSGISEGETATRCSVPLGCVA